MNKTRKIFQSVHNLTLKNVENIATKGHTMKKQKDPLLIVKYGPPGSGKSSSIVYGAIKNLGRPMNSYVDINIDTYVEMIEEYRKGIESGENLYNKTRTTKNRSGMSIYDKTKHVLKKAIGQRSNLIIEITGGYEVGKSGPLGWIIKMIENTPYKIVLIYPKVSLKTITKRMEHRFRKRKLDELKKEYELSVENFNKYLKHPNKHAKYIKQVIVLDNEPDRK